MYLAKTQSGRGTSKMCQVFILSSKMWNLSRPKIYFFPQDTRRFFLNDFFPVFQSHMIHNNKYGRIGLLELKRKKKMKAPIMGNTEIIKQKINKTIKKAFNYLINTSNNVLK